MRLSTAEIRKKFTDFFQAHQHHFLPSSSLVPVGDDSLFFTNAGMVQFKGIFLGKEPTDYNRVTTIQRCLRASGKHNDLSNVGYTKRHHTFFEMLGNFSFGNYFKREAIHFAWQFLTEELQLAPERLWVTIHEKDLEAGSLWQQEFLASGKTAQGISSCGDQDNFWSMGEVGPCGYSSEIYYDYGAKLAGDPPGCGVEGDRYVEIWNLVFMQFEREKDGKIKSIPNPSIDTGMGLERIAAVLQETEDNYEIDIFKVLGADFRKIVSSFVSFGEEKKEDFYLAKRIASDHARSASFLIADGVFPSNEGKGYVLRSIIRRAVYYIYRFGVKEPCFHQLIPTVVRLFETIYPEVELAAKQAQIIDLVVREERLFLQTLQRGFQLLEGELNGKNYLSGELAFKLHDTYGIPFILTQELAKNKNIEVDTEGFNLKMEKQRILSRRTVALDEKKKFQLDNLPVTKFTGYQNLKGESKILSIFREKVSKVQKLEAGEDGVIVLDFTPFYGEGGGQIGDTGELVWGESVFVVTDTQKENGIYLHYGRLFKGNLEIGMQVIAQVDKFRRQAIQANHSATHLLHQVLRDLLGKQATQRGSSVDANKLRFDFFHMKALTKEECLQLEISVNEQIRANLPVKTEKLSLEEAKLRGATALFNEKYEKEVRVVSMGDNYSQELCGGTHVNATGEIGYFKFLEEKSIAAGVRRIEAITGKAAVDEILANRQVLEELQGRLHAGEFTQLPGLLEDLVKEKAQQVNLIKNLQEQLLRQKIQSQLQQKQKILVMEATIPNLKRVWDIVKQEGIKENFGVVLIYCKQPGNFRILVGVAPSYLTKFSANKILQELLAGGLGHGGGRDDLAEGGGNNEKSFEHNLLRIKERLVEALKIQE